MTPFNDEISSLAEDLRTQASDLKDNAFASLIYTADIVNRYLAVEMAKYGARRTKYNILHTLITHGGSMTPTEMSRRVFRSKHTITRAVDSLEAEGLVRRKPIGGDRRVREVRITRKGLDAVIESVPYRRGICDTALSCLSKKQIEELRVILKQLRHHILSQINRSTSQGR